MLRGSWKVCIARTDIVLSGGVDGEQVLADALLEEYQEVGVGDFLRNGDGGSLSTVSHTVVLRIVVRMLRLVVGLLVGSTNL